MIDLRLVSFSDLHMGHPKILASNMQDHVKQHLFPYIKNSNIVLSGGDFFHRLLNFGTPSSIAVLSLVEEFLDLISQNNITCRILRGTFLHDRLQNTIFNALTDASSRFIDIKCIDILCVEYLEKYDLRILYIPDNLPYANKSEVMESIYNLLELNDWEYVDIVVGHGYFEHVLPPDIPHAPSIIFSIQDFKDIIKGYILMGHVHTSSKYKNVLYNGSFERLSHGEEENKGFYLVERTNDIWKNTFIVNESSTLFSTIKPNGNTVSELQENMDKLITEEFGENPSGYLRLLYDNVELRQILVKTISDKYPNLEVTLKILKEQKSEVQVSQEFLSQTVINLTKENLPSFILEHAKETNSSTVLTQNTIVDYLKLQEE